MFIDKYNAHIEIFEVFCLEKVHRYEKENVNTKKEYAKISP